MALSGSFRSGRDSRVQVGATNLNMAKWDADSSGDDIDTNNFEGNGYGEGVVGIVEASLSADGIWNAAANPIDSPPGLYPRWDLQNLKFYLNKAENFWSFPYARVTSSKNSSAVKEKVGFSFSGKSNGIFYPPTGSY